MTWSKSRLFAFSGIVFAILAGYKTVQHLTFNTYAYDLGIRASILYNMAFQGRVWDSLNNLHGFSGHFHPISYLLAGLYWIWPNPLLLCLLQALAASAGLLLFVLLMDRLVEDKRKHVALIALFLANPFLHNVLCYDFHPEIFAIPLVLLFFFLMERSEGYNKDIGVKLNWGGTGRGRPQGNTKYLLGLLPAFCLLALKEDMGLLVFSLGIYALARRKWLMGSLMALVGLAWLPFVLTLVIPHFHAQGQTPLISLHYQVLGSSSAEIMGTLLKNPWLVLTQVFARSETLVTIALLAASVGSLALARWEVLLVLPLLFAQLVSDYPHQMALTWQYSAGILPLLFFSMIKGAGKVRVGIMWLLAALAIPSAVMRFPNPFVQGVHTQRIRDTYRVIKMIPDTASVAVSNNLAPHLVNRRNVRLYPETDDARFILVDLEANIYPATWGARYEELERLSAGYRRVYSEKGLVLVEKNAD